MYEPGQGQRPCRKNEIVRHCKAYPFPHRLSGGKCDGTLWAEAAYHDLNVRECHTCLHNTSEGCEVALGIESLHMCQHLDTLTNQ